MDAISNLFPGTVRPIVTAVRMSLRPYQADAKADIYQAWDDGAVNVLAVLPTGSGKTVTFSDILRDHNGPSCAIAHRQELVSQISVALARDGVRHRIIGPKNVVKLCVNLHMAEVGVSYYDPSARCAVAGVDTLVRKDGTGKDGDLYAQKLKNNVFQMWGPRVAGQWTKSIQTSEPPQRCLSGQARPRDRDYGLLPWTNSVTLWVTDEAHHCLSPAENKWGKAAAMFPNAKGLGVTATPTRADGKGLGRHADGLFDVMVEGPGMRDLITMGYLTDYRIFAPPSDLVIDTENVGGSGDWSRQQLKKAASKSHIVGDVVGHYQRIAPGKLGVCFATDVETATDIAARFNAAGVPAEVVSAKTPDADRIAILARFKRRELLMLVNVDLFGEGFDLPAIEVVIMARPTQSFALFVQQFGRALRLMVNHPTWDTLTNEQRRDHIALSSKPHAIIIDHVGNVERHGLPDARREWTLDRRERRGKSVPSDVIPVRVCGNVECMAVYERIYKACPFCGYVTPPAGRSSPEQVDGDLIELDAAALAEMRGEVARVDMTEAEKLAEVQSKHMPVIGQRAELKRHRERQEAQEALRASMAWWGGYHRAAGQDDSEIYRRFYFGFQVDMMTAQTLKTADTLALAERVNIKLGELA